MIIVFCDPALLKNPPRTVLPPCPATLLLDPPVTQPYFALELLESPKTDEASAPAVQYSVDTIDHLPFALLPVPSDNSDAVPLPRFHNVSPNPPPTVPNVFHPIIPKLSQRA